ncbi:MAG: acyltransferase domain-containing protein, partial [Nitrospinota bacterium]
FTEAGATQKSCAIGSVKSMIGHTKCTAGVAGLIKAALALYHKVLPPTIGIKRPNPILAESPFYVNTEPRPWLQGAVDHPRRAGVSAFGFGGTNFHAVLEEYRGNFLEDTYQAASQHWSSELFLWKGESRQALLEAIAPLANALTQGAKPALSDLAYTVWEQAREKEGLTLAIVATSLEDLGQKLSWVREALSQPENRHIQNPKGIYFSEAPLARAGKIAFLFPGQGSQYPDMLRDLALQFAEVRERFEQADRVLSDRFPQPLSYYIFPPPRFSREEEQRSRQALTQTNVAQPALGAADMGAFALLQSLGIAPDMVAGHSYGEYVALCAARVFSEEVLYLLSEARGRFIIEAGKEELGTMAAVEGEAEKIAEALPSLEGVWIANLNSPKQTIISGTQHGIEEAIRLLQSQGFRTRPVPVSCAFHSPLVAPARDRLAGFLKTFSFSSPHIAVFSNTTASPYPTDPQEMITLLSDHLVRPVQFAAEIEAMYQAGARVFIEVGPRNVLTSLTQQILGERAYVAISLDQPGRSGLLQLHHALGQLAGHGVPVRLDRLYQGREVRQLNLATLVKETRETPLSPRTWLIDGGRAWPVQEPPKVHPPLKLSTNPSPPPRTEERVPPASTPRGEPVAPPPPQPASTPHLPVSDESVSQVMLQFQQLMNRFLETQQQVMLAYLQGSPGEMPLPSPLSEPSQVSEASLSSPPLVQPESVDTRPESPAPPAPQGKGSAPRESTPGPEEAATWDAERLTAELLQIVSERTGYPPEMLDLDLDM